MYHSHIAKIMRQTANNIVELGIISSADKNKKTFVLIAIMFLNHPIYCQFKTLLPSYFHFLLNLLKNIKFIYCFSILHHYFDNNFLKILLKENTSLKMFFENLNKYIYKTCIAYAGVSFVYGYAISNELI